jgi:hypothetical protein
MAAKIHSIDFPSLIRKIGKVILPEPAGSARTVNKDQGACAPHFCGPDVFKHQMINGYLQKNSLAFSTGFSAYPLPGLSGLRFAGNKNPKQDVNQKPRAETKHKQYKQ